MSSRSQTCLFLHWGPGSHAGVERLWFGSKLPISWWDQPQPGAEDNAFEAIISATEREAVRLSQEAGRPIALLAHSFGGQIALELSRRIPDKISAISLMSCGEFPPRGFIRLGRALLDTGKGGEPLKAALNAAEQDLSVPHFVGLIQQIASIERYLDAYWAPSHASVEARTRYYEFARSCEGMNIPLFLALMGEIIRRGPHRTREPFNGKVSVFLGKHDPLTDLKDDARQWKTHFPQAEVIQADSGHFTHLELPPEMWISSII